MDLKYCYRVWRVRALRVGSSYEQGGYIQVPDTRSFSTSSILTAEEVVALSEVLLWIPDRLTKQSLHPGIFLNLGSPICYKVSSLDLQQNTIKRMTLRYSFDLFPLKRHIFNVLAKYRCPKTTDNRLHISYGSTCHLNLKFIISYVLRCLRALICIKKFPFYLQ
jgi:hypothetical protein